MAIRRTTDDFRVEEDLTPEFSGSLTSHPSDQTPFAICRLSKNSLTTPDAVVELAFALRMPPGKISYGGLKDRHAATSQHVSIERPSAASITSLARGMEGKGWRARTVGWSSQAIDASCIGANAFEIMVRGLHPEAVDRMKLHAARLTTAPGELLVANYFGDQRFGSARHGQGFAARELLAGDPLTALQLAVGTPARKDSGMQRIFTRLCAEHWGDWALLAERLPACADRRPFERLATGASPESAFMALRPFLRGMTIEAFQSLLWNDGLRRMIRSLGLGVIETEDEFGSLLFPAAADVPRAWPAAQAPMPSPEMTFESPWAGAWREALAAERLTAETLVIPGINGLHFGHAVRTLFMRVASFSMEPDCTDSSEPGARAVMTRFTLPRGAYATVVLRALGQ